MKNYLSLLIFFLFSSSAFSQYGSISGKITDANTGEEMIGAMIFLQGTTQGALTNENGEYEIGSIRYGRYDVTVVYIGYDSSFHEVFISETADDIELDVRMEEQLNCCEPIPLCCAQRPIDLNDVNLDPVVLTGTRTSKRQTNTAVIVNVINTKTLDNVQACNLSEGLRFQPGLRVETDCQTCNYTQLRMNGLGGGYSQILINGRPIFSPLTGLYGMEQLPVNMIERIEVVRGGGSALYGSSAIGGTVNVITKVPKKSSYDVGYTFQNIGGQTMDHMVLGNATVVNKKQNAGGTIFFNNRNRDVYDHNGDGFSELPSLQNTSFGANMFFLPGNDQKLEVSLSNLREYRYGGEIVDGPAHMASQAEERDHNVFIGNIDYQINFNDGNSSLIAYAAGQNTDRTHYTGIFPDEDTEVQVHVENPPYGSSDNYTVQGGVQFDHRLPSFLGGSNVLTVGTEYVHDDVLDVIEAYNYTIDQTTRNLGAFFQSDWEITPALNLLAGVRADKHNLVNKVIVSPRASLLYKLKRTTQFRLNWATGFRAPQAFDADLHIAFAGGGISRVSLDPNLVQERSQSWSASVNYDKAFEKFIFGYTVEGFYTHLNNAFYLHPLGEDQFGERFEKRNGDGATVQGATLELRANYNRKVQLEAGFTLQSSLFDEAVENIEGLEARREFLRTPNHYGYGTLTITPTKRWNTAINMVYTGKMDLVHFAGAPEQTEDAYVVSPSFTELSLKTGYTFPIDRFKTGIEVFGGVKNLFNAYQSDFDTGKNRDSNYVYGPAAPRTVFAGLRIRSL